MTAVYTCLALVAFAANSLLCRLALGSRAIDPASFTTIRLVAGAAMLTGVVAVRRSRGEDIVRRSREAANVRTPNDDRSDRRLWPRWQPAVALFVYAIAFSYAYVSLPVATGALILFGAVQTTMLGTALRAGERPRTLEWIGFLSAVGGLGYLVAPGITAPSAAGSVMMAVSGVAWGWYSLLGRYSSRPVDATTRNFIRASPFAVAVSAATLGGMFATGRGALMAASSGALSSGLGYVAWYAALPRLTATRAAIVQLATPVLTAVGGVLFLSERVSARLAVAAALILGGIAVAVFSRIKNP